MATELLEKALLENADRDGIFTTSSLNSDGEVVTQDLDDVEELIRQRQRNSKKPTISRTAAAAAASRPRTPAITRRRLGDVTREFGGMDVSDGDDL